MVDGHLTLTVDIVLMSIQHVLPTLDAGEKMSAQCLVLIIYFCLSFKALVEVKHAIRIYINIELYFIVSINIKLHLILISILQLA